MSTLAIPRLFWPVTIAAGSNDAVRATLTGAGGSYSATVAAATYYSPESLADAVASALATAASATVTATVSADGVVSFAVTKASLSACSLVWTHSAATKALGVLLGFGADAASIADHAGTVDGTTATHAASLQCQQFWTPGVPVESSDPTVDSVAEVARTAGGQNRSVRFAGLTSHRVGLSFLPAHKVFTADEGAGQTNQALQRLVTSAAGIGRFRWWPDRGTVGTYSDRFLLQESAEKFAPERQYTALPLYRATLAMGEFTE